MNECFNFYANEMSSRDDVDDELYSSCDQMFFRTNTKLNDNSRIAISRDIRDAYYECFDVDAFIERNNNERNAQTFNYVYSRMHAMSFVILNIDEMITTFENNERAYARGDMF
jgi:hypothetical protein